MYQEEITDFCKQFYKNVLINTTSIIPPLELDIVIPEINLAIQFNGLNYHSELNGTNKFYHNQKYQLCKSKNYQLFVIWDFQWKSNKKLIKTNLLSYLFKEKFIPKNYTIEKQNLSYSLLENNILISQLILDKNFYIKKYFCSPLYNDISCLKLLLPNFPIYKKLICGKQKESTYLKNNFKIKKFISPKSKIKYGIKYFNCGEMILSNSKEL